MANVKGLEAVKRKLRTHARAAMDAGLQQSRKEAEIIAGLMRAFAPVEERELIASIRVEDVDTFSFGGTTVGYIGVVVKAGDESTIITNDRGTRFQNAKLQENGTQNMPANPYFNPAKRLRRRAARSNISRAVNKAWKAGR
ncbi:hypothetical protein [Paracoccus methylarcula]|uniref:HK97 gp10 family phage protein n=1 Tax=Paracoccus methylarcula TaxID=72022 RepID=A0A422QSE0_9RHOB|nr:hypothetical protein [Paracoccus methylarcula]RNF32948.1 hypothetical protein A7A09_019235 [Paracoccus methylarcula]